MSGTRALAVFEFELNPLLGDPREQIRRMTCDLPSGSYVRVICSMRAIPFGSPILTYLDTGWYRDDIHWQFIADPKNWDWASGWRALADFHGCAR